MELIYFISGVLTVGTVYGVLLLRKVKSSYDEVLEESSRLYSLTQMTQDEIAGKFDSVRGQLIEVLDNNEKLGKQMSDDAYAGNTELNERITDLAKTFNTQGLSHKKLFDIADSQFRKINSDIQILNNALKRFQDDPDLKARY
jgi:hypothetical protein